MKTNEIRIKYRLCIRYNGLCCLKGKTDFAAQESCRFGVKYKHPSVIQPWRRHDKTSLFV